MLTPTSAQDAYLPGLDWSETILIEEAIFGYRIYWDSVLDAFLHYHGEGTRTWIVRYPWAKLSDPEAADLRDEIIMQRQINDPAETHVDPRLSLEAQQCRAARTSRPKPATSKSRMS